MANCNDSALSSSAFFCAYLNNKKKEKTTKRKKECNVISQSFEGENQATKPPSQRASQRQRQPAREKPRMREKVRGAGWGIPSFQLLLTRLKRFEATQSLTRRQRMKGKGLLLVFSTTYVLLTRPRAANAHPAPTVRHDMLSRSAVVVVKEIDVVVDMARK